MQARRAARELALILFSQMSNIKNLNKSDFQNIVLKSVRTLTNSSAEELKEAVKSILEIKEYISEYEANHPKNIQRPIDVSDVPVPMLMTSDVQEKLDELLNIAEKTMLAIEIAEMAALEENSDVKEYIINIASAFTGHKKDVDEQIKKYALGWDINRMVKMDKDILRIAICELLYVKAAPLKVVIDEAVELAKKYSTDDSASFVNGILARVVVENNLK
ncbi:MAG: transcription antitermination factor NusB [Candidatus Gastranaerophilales bacterium]|nr:transcription antitermination factor NusB [Candidatus Gastranaerophilales bacterium]